MDVVNPDNMQSILTDTGHAFVPSINIPGYNIEKIDTTLSANLTYPDSDYVGNDKHTNHRAASLDIMTFQRAMTG